MGTKQIEFRGRLVSRISTIFGLCIFLGGLILMPMWALAQTSTSFTAQRWGLTSKDLNTLTGPQILQKARFTTRISEVRSAGSNGDPYAKLMLGIGHRDAIGVTRDTVVAAEQFGFACDQSLAVGCLNLAYVYDERARNTSGADYRQNTSVAHSFFVRSCDLGNGKGCVMMGDKYWYGEGVPKDLTKATVLYGRGCDYGDGLGCTRRGSDYQEGRGVPVSFTTANQFFIKGCNANHAGSCYLLAANYNRGRGVEPNDTRMVQLYSKACDLQDGEACSTLASLYSMGTRVPRNQQRSLELYRQSCELEDGFGCNKLGVFYVNGTGLPRDPRRAAEVFEKSCDEDYAEGCGNLGSMYATGNGVARDLRKAQELFVQGCEAGSQDVCEKIAAFRGRSTPETARSASDNSGLSKQQHCEVAADLRTQSGRASFRSMIRDQYPQMQNTEIERRLQNTIVSSDYHCGAR